MVTWEIVKKLAPWILATLVIGSLIWWVSHTPYVAGQRDIQEQWDAERATYKKAIDTLKDRYATLEARLDRSLEEGRRMVAELSATLRQRDDQLRAVSKQLENDRSLFMTGDKK